MARKSRGKLPWHWLWQGKNERYLELIGSFQSGLTVRLVDRKIADRMISENHYSRTRVANSRFHFGVFQKEQLLGALTFGYVKNPGTQCSIVKETGPKEYLELNRMWLSDDLGKNSESQCIGMALRFLKRRHPEIQWIQSFADGRVGVGTIYQASNFWYLGRHKTTFWKLRGKWFHEQLMTVRTEKRVRPGTRAWILQENRNKAKPYTFWQYRYLYPLGSRKWIQRRLCHRIRPYPKHCDNTKLPGNPRGRATSRVPLRRPPKRKRGKRPGAL